MLIATSSSGSEQSHWSSSGSGGRVNTITAPPIPPWPAAGSRKCGTWGALKDDHGPLQCRSSRPTVPATNATNKAVLADKITGQYNHSNNILTVLKMAMIELEIGLLYQ